MREKKKLLKFDPRTKILLLLLANIVAFTHNSIKVELTWVVLLLLLLSLSGLWQKSIKFFCAFTLCLLFQYYIFPNAPSIIANTFFIIVSYARKIFPCLIVGSLIINTTTLREIMEALRSMYFPEKLIIPLSVTIRYFPAIKEEIQHIRDAMKLRNIYGTKKFEGYLVPIIVSASNTADELAAAAVTRGIENPCKKTTIVKLKINIQDIICLLLSVIFCSISILKIW